MRFNPHSNLLGQHALLSASKYHWINYDEEKMEMVFFSNMAAQRGTELHSLAHQLIRLGVKLPRTEATLSRYVNDAIGFRMTPEQILYYSDNCFGTADCISFRKGVLRVHDLKTGKLPTSMHQLEVYAAHFCLEYRMKPFDITTELRIYQNDDVRIDEADPDIITHVMDKIITLDKQINVLRGEL